MIVLRKRQMGMKWRRLFAVVCIGFLGVLYAAPVHADLEEIQIEEQLASRLQRYLDGIYGDGNFLVRVDVTVTSPRYEVRYTKQSDAKVREEPQGKVNILPGYPIIKNLGPDSLNKLPFDSITTLIRPQIQKIVVDVVAEKSFPKGQVGRAQQLIREVVGLQNGRDSINVSYRPFSETAPATQKIEIVQAPQPFKTFQNLFYGLMLIFVLVFILVYTWLQIKSTAVVKSLSGLAAAGGSSGSGSGGPSVSVNPSFEMPKGSGSSGDVKLSSGAQVKRYFDFIGDDNIDKLQHLLKTENLGLENISAIVAFLSPDLAAKLLASMDIKVVAQISVSLLDQRMMPRATMDKLEAHIRSSVECLAGGEPRFQQLVGCFSGPIKKSLLAMLSSNAPDVYRRVRPYVLLFEDIKLLSDDEIKILLSDVRMELFAVALASVDEATYARVDQNLTKSARDMIAQYLDLRGGSVSAEDIARAQDTVLATIARLESEGKLQLKSKLVA